MNQLANKTICQLADVQIVHLQKYNYFDYKSTYKDIKESIELLGSIVEKYSLFFNDKNINRKALDNDSWTDLFKIKWID